MAVRYVMHYVMQYVMHHVMQYVMHYTRVAHLLAELVAGIIRLQPLSHTNAAPISYGYSLHHIRLQPHLLAELVATVRDDRVGFVDEEHAAQRRLDHLVVSS